MVVTTGNDFFGLMPAPKQTYSSSKKNHDFLASNKSCGLLKSKATAPYNPSLTAPTKLVRPSF